MAARLEPLGTTPDRIAGGDYCRGEKVSVTFTVTPAATNSSSAPMPPAVAGIFYHAVRVTLAPFLAKFN